jgi:hypothetical protein
LAVITRHWVAAGFLLLGVLWMISVPIRLRGRRSNCRPTR